MNVGKLITRLQEMQATHGDVPVYLIHEGGNVLEAVAVGYDCYEQDEGVVIEIIAEGETP